MASFTSIERTVTRITRFIALIGLAGLLALALATVLDVLLRWIFNSPMVGLRDTHSLFMALIIASCFPLCIYERGNITIRFLGNVLGPRGKDILDVFGNLVTLIIFSLMAWQFWLFTDQLAQDGENTWVLNWPVSPWWRVVTILIIICVPVTIAVVIQCTKSAMGKESTSDQRKSSADHLEEGDM